MKRIISVIVLTGVILAVSCFSATASTTEQNKIVNGVIDEVFSVEDLSEEERAYREAKIAASRAYGRAYRIANGLPLEE